MKSQISRNTLNLATHLENLMTLKEGLSIIPLYGIYIIGFVGKPMLTYWLSCKMKAKLFQSSRERKE